MPCCCGKYFRDNWQEAKDKYQGDLFRKLILDSDEKETKIPWQINIFSLYCGSSLIFHFPYSIHCPATISMVNERRKWLTKIDSGLTEEIVNYHQKSFFIDKNGYQDLNCY